MRFSPRVEMKIPAEIEIGAEKKDILITSLGLDGAFIRNSIPAFDGKPLPNGLVMRYELPQQGVLEHTVNIVRKDADGYALSFHDVAHAIKLKLWQYIVDNLVPMANAFSAGSGIRSCRKSVKTAAGIWRSTNRVTLNTMRRWWWSKGWKTK